MDALVNFAFHFDINLILYDFELRVITLNSQDLSYREPIFDVGLPEALNNATSPVKHSIMMLWWITILFNLKMVI
jgi:hypothetical protein